MAFGAVIALAAASGPSAGQPAPAAKPAGADAAGIAKGHELFNTFGCGGCHTLADAGASGRVGPSFDGDSNLNQDFVVNRVTNGQGMMPAFAGQMSPEEIADIAAYITHAAAK